MSELDYSALRQLQAAEGWLGLGDWREAERELGQIPPQLRSCSEARRVQCEIRSAAGDWEEAARIAKHLMESEPKDPFGYVRSAYALHELKRTQEAWDTLLPAVPIFPKEWVIPYNLACYASQLGKLDTAWDWLKRAAEVSSRQSIREKALEDPDLRPLRAKIMELW